MIAVNWGTTNFRAYRIGAGAEVLERRESPGGILSVEAGNFATALRGEIGDWLDEGERQILLAGMVGSRQGWKEAQYVSCPGGVAELVGAMVVVDFEQAEVRLAPGMICFSADGIPDVMRGEETEILGVLNGCESDDTICLPGTHAKWVRVEDGKITAFQTFMTGEIFAALSTHTILARLMTAGPMLDAAFLRGVDRSRDAGGVLHHLFGVRTLVLTAEMKEQEASSYLSGLLIGHEVRAMIREHQHIHLVGASQLCSLYQKAIAACGGRSTIAIEDAAARGLTLLGRRLLWI